MELTKEARRKSNVALTLACLWLLVLGAASMKTAFVDGQLVHRIRAMAGYFFVCASALLGLAWYAQRDYGRGFVLVAAGGTVTAMGVGLYSGSGWFAAVAVLPAVVFRLALRTD